MDLLMLAKEVNPLQGVSKVIYQLVGIGGALILLTIVFRGLGLLNKMAIQGLLGLIGVGLLLMLFTDGENSKQLLQNWADWLRKYLQGESGP
ncbi:hypothetical protein SAMN05444392_11163 [Seinonella peptonophila]|uniref:Uncharacterized protein n=1 Tax=Seinonella peptonophila TaxID=112248 RepID=A0A1M4ZZD8_9BACL|nr:hypothetical protein [Seinonella peptonophila]SHF23368.1 hypothetical protein SAMN05444392_11163 [Seinonella peptonophila]